MRKIVKIIVFSCVYLSTFLGKAQIDAYSSFYFSEPQPSSLENIESFDDDFFGVYRLEDDRHTKLKVEKDSILAKYMVAFQLTMHEIDSNQNYYIENNLLYGVAPVGLHFINENDTLLVALNQEELYCSTKNRVIRKLGNTLYINQEVEQGKWVTSIMTFTGKSIEINNLNHILSEKEINKMPKDIETEGDLTIYVASPSEKQFYALVKSKGYNFDTIKYKKD